MLYSIGTLLIRGIAWFDFILATALLYLFSFFPKKFIETRYRPLFRKWCWLFIRALGVTLKLHQKNTHPLPKQYILIGNHPSVFEDLGMSAAFNVRFLAKEEIKYWYILGRISLAAGTLYVKRESRDSRKVASAQLIALLQQGDSIGLYPEGGCKGRRLFLPFLYGAFDAAIQSGVPIIPVFLHYEAQEAFEWRPQEPLLHKLWEIANSANKTANYYVFDAIDPKQFNSKETLCEYVQNLYLKWQKQYLE